MTAGRSGGWWTLGFLLLGLWACEASDPVTEVLVDVHTDMRVDVDLHFIKVDVMDRAGKRSVGPSQMLELMPTGKKPTDKDQGKHAMPISFSLVPTNGAEDFRLVVTGLDERRQPIVEQQAIASFDPNERLALRIELNTICARRELFCRTSADARTDQTCGPRGVCVRAVVDKLQTRAEYVNGTDAGRPDAGRRDGGVDGSTKSDAEVLPPGECARSEDCEERIENAEPRGCVIPSCNLETHRCEYRAADHDNDTFPTSKCEVPGLELELGPDCYDADPERNPNAWDGPTTATQPLDRCDQQDDDCNGVPDDGVDGGKGCACDDAQQNVDCYEREDRTPIEWPAGKPTGVCRAGKRSCVGGKWSPCVGAIESMGREDECVAPTEDAADGDCDGKKNEGCACPAGATRPCGTDEGSCELGMQTCVNGKWSEKCEGQTVPKLKDSCDRPNDDNCNGKLNEGCECLATDLPRLCSMTVPSTGTWGDCPTDMVDCVGGRWDVAKDCIKVCNQCEIPANAAMCAPNGTCKDLHNSFRCECKPGYRTGNGGKSCVPDPCSLNPCMPYGCIQEGTTEGWLCACPPGFHLDPVTKHSCIKNEVLVPCPAASLVALCSGHGMCVPGATDWSCKCENGYEYKAADKSCNWVPKCTATPSRCAVGTTCEEAPGTPDGFTCKPIVCGTDEMLVDGKCVPKDPCAGVTCGLGGTCVPDAMGSYLCRCPATGTTQGPMSKSCEACPAGFNDCDPTTAGCETDVRSDERNCGACGSVCPDLSPFFKNQCKMGSCTRPSL